MRADAIVQLAGMLGVKSSVHRTYVQIECPFSAFTHAKGSDRHPSCNVMVDEVGRSGFRCHSCGEGGSLGYLAVRWSLLTHKDATPIQDLIEREEESVAAVHNRLDRKFDSKWEPHVEEKIKQRDFEVFDDVELEKFGGKVPQWVLDKGISIATCKEWQLGCDSNWRDPATNEMWQRVVIPIHRKDGKLVGLMGRVTDPAAPNKYWNYWHFPKTNYLFGLHKLKSKDRVMVVEGMFDVIRLWEYGLPVVGMMGKEVSEKQFQLLLEFERVYIALDADKAGEQGMEVLARKLNDRVPIFRVRFPNGKVDPKDMTKEEAFSAVETAKRIL